MEIIEKILENQIKNDIESIEVSGELHNLGEDEILEDEQTIFATSGTSTGEVTRSPVMNDNLKYYRKMNGKSIHLREWWRTIYH